MVTVTTDQGYDPVKLTLTQAADACGVSRSTIKRKHKNGEFPNASQSADGVWAIPVPDLLAAGLNPGRPSPPDSTTQVSGPGAAAPPTHADLPLDPSSEPIVPLPMSEYIALREALASATANEQAARQVAEERQKALDDLRRIVHRQLTGLSAGEEPPAEAESTTQHTVVDLREPASPHREGKRRWWQRRPASGGAQRS